MKQLSKEAQVQRNGGAIAAGDPYAAQCTTCYVSWSCKTRSVAAALGRNHYNYYWKKNKTTHRWAWLREG